jgi:hypothetical protein
MRTGIKKKSLRTELELKIKFAVLTRVIPGKISSKKGFALRITTIPKNPFNKSGEKKLTWNLYYFPL